MQDLHTEDYKIFLREIKDVLIKWRYIPCSWIRRYNIAKILILFKMTYIFNTVSSKILPGISVGIDKFLVNIIWKFKGPRIAKTILKKKNKIGRIRLPDFKTCYKVRVIQTVWYWCMNRSIEKKAGPDKDLNTYGQLIFTKVAKDSQ